MAAKHPLAAYAYIEPEQLADQTLITYPVERQRLDVFTQFLDPADVSPAEIRKAELTPIIMQLVASLRGVTALPNWAISEYQHSPWLRTAKLGEQGIWRTLYAAKRSEDTDADYITAFLDQARSTCFTHLKGIIEAV